MTLRIARHTSQLENMVRFYTDVLGFQILGSFHDHAGYDGVMLGNKNAGWHLEFTQSSRPASHHFDKDDLLVLYPASLEEYKAILDRVQPHKIRQIRPENPYWIENGIVIGDPDRFKIVISPLMIRLDNPA
ncbi:MAG: VOC family protein [Bacteroidota bacterium]